MFRRTLLALGGGLLLGGAASAPVRIGWLRAPNDITLGKARGTLERAFAALGAPVEWIGPFSAAAPAMEALNAGRIDITNGSSITSIAGLAAGMPVVMFAYQKMSDAGEAILVRKDSPCATLKDLIGRKVAVNRGGSGEYLLTRGFEHNGLDPAAVKRVFLSPADSAAAFSRGYVDAWATWDPFLSLALRNYDARVLADGAAIGSENAISLVAHREFAEQRTPLLEAAFATILSDNAWSLARTEEAGRIWVEAMGVAPDLAPAIGRNNAVPTHGMTAADITQMNAIADWCFKYGVIPNRPEIEKGIVRL